MSGSTSFHTRSTVKYMPMRLRGRILILVGYVGLLAVVAVASSLATREILVMELDDRVSDTLDQEVLEFEQLVEVGRNPETSQPYRSAHELLEVFVERQVARDDEAILAFAEGAFFRGKTSRFPLDRLPQGQQSAFAAYSSKTAEAGPTEGTFETGLGTARFRARRVVIGDTSGALVVALLPVGQLDEIAEFPRWSILTTFGVLLLASVIVWIMARLVTRRRPITP